MHTKTAQAPQAQGLARLVLAFVLVNFSLVHLQSRDFPLQ